MSSRPRAGRICDARRMANRGLPHRLDRRPRLPAPHRKRVYPHRSVGAELTCLHGLCARGGSSESGVRPGGGKSAAPRTGYPGRCSSSCHPGGHACSVAAKPGRGRPHPADRPSARVECGPRLADADTHAHAGLCADPQDGAGAVPEYASHTHARDHARFCNTPAQLDKRGHSRDIAPPSAGVRATLG